MLKRTRLAVVYAILLCSCNVGTTRPPEAISTESAQKILQRAEMLAQSGDVDALCEISFSPRLCEIQLDTAGGVASIPQQPPEMVDSYIVNDEQLPNGDRIVGGRVLVLEGVDGLGEPYRTEFLVFDTGLYGLKPHDAIYWSGVGVE